VFAAVAVLVAAVACAHKVPVHEGIKVLTMSNISLASTGDWLLVLYAPWCSHCHSFLDNLADIATKIRAINSKTYIGVINADAEPAVQMQFSMHGFPSIYMAHDGEVYEFPIKSGRSTDNVVSFATKGYAKETPLTGIKAPFGIAMRAFALYSAFAIGSYRFLEVYAQKLNIPPMWFFCGIAVLFAVLVIVVMIVLSRCRQPKKCPAPRKSSNKTEDAAIQRATVQRARAENPIEGAAIAETEKVQEQVKKAKEEQELHRRAIKKDKEGTREQQKEAQKKMGKSSKGSARQQNMPTQQPQKRSK